MGEMTQRERILATIRKQRADKLPFLHNWRHMQQGRAERECRMKGMGISWARPSYIYTMHGVKMTETQEVTSGEQFIHRTYSTPVGEIFVEEKRNTGVEQWHALRSWADVQPWQVSRAIKGPEDYKVLKYMIENTEYAADYFPIEQAKDWLGEDGVVMDFLPHSPIHELLITWIGADGGQFFIHQARYPELVEDLYKAMAKSYEPLYDIAAKSPADFVFVGENLDGFLVDPRLFQKYYMPEYEKMGKVFHENGKLFAAHVDGSVAVLKNLIARTPIDIIEALHSPPMGDLPIGEALSLWKDKIIWTGFPASVYANGPEAVKKHMLNLLREVGTGDRLVVEVSTENQVSNENMMMLTSVLENATLPLTMEKIDEIERSLG
jgi:hypothetical protein